MYNQITRAFRTRLALASFKAERGWQDIKFDEIEPHVEQEAAKNRQAREMELQQQQHRQQQPQQSYSAVPQSTDEGLMGPPLTAHGQKRARGGSLATASMANTTMYDQYLSPSHNEESAYASPSPSHHNGDTYATSPYVNTQSPYRPTASTSALPSPAHFARTSQHQPHQHQQFTTTLIGGGNDSHRQKRRQTTASESLPNFVAGHVSPPRRPLSAGPLHSPRTRNSATRSSIHRMPDLPNGSSSSGQQSQQPLSTADPNFSSFVDAASVLTGLSRGPSESNLLGPDDDGSQMRPQTPPRLDKSKSAATNENDTAGAAELMLFLAASPSPARVRTTPHQGILGEGMKGRRLFGGNDEGIDERFATGSNGRSNMENGGGGAGSAYSNALAHSSSLMDSSTGSSIFDFPGASQGSTRGSGASVGGLQSAATFDSSSSGPTKATSTSTPTRERNPSGTWDSYLNVSPSPTRASASQAFSMPLTSLSPTSLPLGRQTW